jgi:hypothetical protein
MGHVKKPKAIKEPVLISDKEEGVTFGGEPEFDSVTVGIMKGVGRQRIVVKIPFNTTTLEVGAVQIIEEAEDNQLAQSTFKREIMKNGLFT